MPDIFNDQELQANNAEEHTGGEVQLNPHSLPHKVSMVSSFVRDPLGVALAEQHEDEHILLFIRRDFVVNIPWILLSLVLLIVPFFTSIILQPFNFSFSLIPTSLIIILTGFYFLLVLGYIFANFVTWFYDIGIVTEKRAIDIDFYNISFVSVATARAEDLKDVRYSQRGFFESLFDYGDVTLVVEASGETLTFEKSPRPAEVVSILSALIGGHQA
ncbi:MAG TPA: hypothetical protein VF810_03610 [Patescibacteria group bacterium]